MPYPTLQYDYQVFCDEVTRVDSRPYSLTFHLKFREILIERAVDMTRDDLFLKDYAIRAHWGESDPVTQQIASG